MNFFQIHMELNNLSIIRSFQPLQGHIQGHVVSHLVLGNQAAS